MLVVEDIEIADHILVFHVIAAEGHRLVENRERIPHCPVRLPGNYMQGLIVNVDILLRCYSPEILHDIRDAYAVEIISLAAGEDSREYLVLLRGRQDEDGMGRRLFQRLQERIEGGLGQHVHLVNDIDAVLPDLRRYLDLVHQGLDVIHAVVGCGIKLMYAVRPSLAERNAGLALAARFHVLRRGGAVDNLGENPGRTGLADTSRSAEKIGVGQLAPDDGILQGTDNIVLANQVLERIRPVLPRRNYILLTICHISLIISI